MDKVSKISISLRNDLIEALDVVSSNRSGFISERLLIDPKIKALVSTNEGEKKLIDLLNEASIEGFGDEVRDFILGKLRKKEAAA